MGILATMLERQPDETRANWAFNITYMVLIQSTIFVFLSGAPFGAYVVWWLIEVILYYGMTIPVILKDQRIVEEDGLFTPLLTTHFYIKHSVFLFWYSILLVGGAYFRDITSRKRFLQRSLMFKQQHQIIRS